MGVEQRRSGRRRRCFAARRHAVRPPPHAPDARSPRPTHTRAAPIATVVNTHANGDHCYGNELVDGAEIIASTATAARDGGGPAGAARRPHRRRRARSATCSASSSASSSSSGIELRAPDRTFDGRLDVDVGGRLVELIEVGPAHTAGDTLVVVPDAGVVYTGDILFIGGTPIVWAGPLANWIAACDLMLGMDVDVVVPGHGPVTDKSGVRAVRDYLAFVDAEATARHAAGSTPSKPPVRSAS